LSADGEFAAAAIGIWKFITRQVVDRTNGEWFWRILPDGTADADEPKVSEWKGPYHNIRMCLEILRRISQGEETGRS
jgi:mannobiose 2-epimerase